MNRRNFIKKMFGFGIVLGFSPFFFTKKQEKKIKIPKAKFYKKLAG